MSQFGFAYLQHLGRHLAVPGDVDLCLRGLQQQRAAPHPGLLAPLREHGQIAQKPGMGPTP